MQRYALMVLLVATSGCADESDPVDPVRAANLSCAAPAPLYGGPDLSTTQDYLVDYRANTQVATTTHRLEAEFDFTAVRLFYGGYSGFTAKLDRRAVQGVRCAPEVESVALEAGGGVLF